MKVLIVGGEGQLGRALRATAPAQARITSHGAATLDITDPAAVAQIVAQLRPEIIFNAAAYTAVDRAESEEARAFAVNATAVGHLAAAARACRALLVHVSTDFVFDGLSDVPYAPDSATAPLGAYGRTKLAGEREAGKDALIVRTAWVYAPEGRNFVRTMLRLMDERPEVRVVADQTGTPTYAPDLAAALWTLAAGGVTGIHHYTDSGTCTWYDFALAIREEGVAAGLVDPAVRVVPVGTADYPTPAQRPHRAVLDKTATFAVLGTPAPHWRANLHRMIGEMTIHG